MNKKKYAYFSILLLPALFLLDRYDPRLIHAEKCKSKRLIVKNEEAKSFAFNFWIEQAKAKPWAYSKSPHYGSVKQFLNGVEQRGKIHIRSEFGIWNLVVEMFAHYPGYYSLNLEFNRCGEIYRDFAI